MKEIMTKKESNGIKLIRVVSTLMILLCHTVYLFGATIGKTSQFFNIAVSVFFYISAYLYSQKSNIDSSVLKWYKKRFIRIATQYYLFLILYFIVNLVFSATYPLKNWIAEITFFAGITNNHIAGLEHLWFVSGILMCYIITPLLYKLRKNKAATILYIIVALTIYVLIAIFTEEIYATYFFAVFEYSIAFLFLKRIIELLKKISQIKCIILGIVIFTIGCMSKLASIYFFDDTILYTRFLVKLCNGSVALGIFITLLFASFAFEKAIEKIQKPLDFFDGISYEFYIVHNALITGGVTSLVLFKNPCLNIAGVFVASTAIGFMINKISKLIYKVRK